ncbi:hypothetical protein FQN60_014687 [Etheostoma spectabile]|uniref:G-protein coupled receptors family 1 profile domain-containing protein n=1 Tax=Etheostoma spectabile TaxID=54343 RepID=A0A5J5CRG6_9PERO|nr:hypothetical protein FQN60_014687 [Etheostoma spectabile]
METRRGVISPSSVGARRAGRRGGWRGGAGGSGKVAGDCASSSAASCPCSRVHAARKHAVCAAVVRFRHLRSKVTTFFVISLAGSDLLVAVLVMPGAITEVTGTWLFGRFCGVWIAFDHVLHGLHLAPVHHQRGPLLGHRQPFKYERKMTQRVGVCHEGWRGCCPFSSLSSRAAQLAPSGRGGDGGGGGNDGCQQGRQELQNSSNANAKSCVANLNKTYAISSSLISFYIRW